MGEGVYETAEGVIPPAPADQVVSPAEDDAGSYSLDPANVFLSRSPQRGEVGQQGVIA